MLQLVGTCKGIKESKFKFEGKILHYMFPYLFGTKNLEMIKTNGFSKASGYCKLNLMYRKF